MKNVIIVGATGATGYQLMQQLINDPAVENIYVVHYRVTPFAHLDKVTEITLDLANFDDLDITVNSSVDSAKEIDCAYCCLGTTRKKAGSLAAFRQVDKDYIVNFGTWVANNTKAQLHVISAVGANAKSASSYLQTKGETELLLRQLPLAALFLYQPTLLHGKRDEFRLIEAVAYYPLAILSLLPLTLLKQQKPIAIDQLANAMYQLSQQVTDGHHVISSLEIQQY
ncbi:short chain dehydrogenase [Moritella sp. Urea-trap-13]|uniref:short chain dehydrogenase n=1 Tax=Moritella sp. Urea-trap-13 TaxID=2058327 RepID=UPI000C326B50|nr:short chain dehydrogenase [Moritella sp. Urea-trap-13]PKH09677.1 short chain dehydrogenase [Moritella sp. Urea-trap-13]